MMQNHSKLTKSPDDGEGNIEGGHEKISKREISNEQVGYCVQPPVRHL